jgi:hypothetical protein
MVVVVVVLVRMVVHMVVVVVVLLVVVVVRMVVGVRMVVVVVVCLYLRVQVCVHPCWKRATIRLRDSGRERRMVECAILGLQGDPSAT